MTIREVELTPKSNVFWWGFEFYYKEEHACYYQVGTNGEIGSLFIPVNADDTIDFHNAGEVEVEWADA